MSTHLAGIAAVVLLGLCASMPRRAIALTYTYAGYLTAVHIAEGDINAPDAQVGDRFTVYLTPADRPTEGYGYGSMTAEVDMAGRRFRFFLPYNFGLIDGDAPDGDRTSFSIDGDGEAMRLTFVDSTGTALTSSDWPSTEWGAERWESISFSMGYYAGGGIAISSYRGVIDIPPAVSVADAGGNSAILLALALLPFLYLEWRSRSAKNPV